MSVQRAEKVVYILGSGRCGSTLLDVILGAHPLIRSTGELNHIPSPAWSSGCTCSCGISTLECPFWTAVRRRLEEEEVELGELAAAQRVFERVRYLPKLQAYSLYPPRLFARYARHLRSLVDVIARESGRPIVVDSSKSPARGLIWNRAAGEGMEVYYIHLVRDGRGYVYSTASSDADSNRRWFSSAGRATLQWVGVNLACSAPVLGRSVRYLRVRYEDLVAEPAVTLERIGRFIRTDLSELITSVQTGGPLQPEHLVGGNRIRMSSRIVLNPDQRWKSGLSSRDRSVFWQLAGPLASHYGYEQHA